MPVLHPPVEAPIVRSFSYAGSPFAGGHHRGVDLAARPGDAVSAPCPGRVLFAGTTPAGAAVTLVCDGARLRVTLLPVRPARRRAAGARVAAGDVVGRVARARDGAHAGLHLGVRRSDDRLGYRDPAPLLRTAAPPLGPAPPAGRAPRERPPPSRPAAPPPPARGEAPAERRPTPSSVRELAPWPVWAGLALVLLGAAGGGTVRLRRAGRPRAAPRRAVVRRE